MSRATQPCSRLPCDAPAAALRDRRRRQRRRQRRRRCRRRHGHRLGAARHLHVARQPATRLAEFVNELGAAGGCRIERVRPSPEMVHHRPGPIRTLRAPWACRAQHPARPEARASFHKWSMRSHTGRYDTPNPARARAQVRRLRSAHDGCGAGDASFSLYFVDRGPRVESCSPT